MRDHIVEIENEGRHLSLQRGFLVISAHGIESGRIPLDDIQALICGVQGATITTPVLAELAQRGVPVVISGEKYLPQAIVWPLDSNHLTSRRIRMQLAAPLPLRKKLWQKIIQMKLNAQADVLIKREQVKGVFIKKMVRKVLSGDRNNAEAAAAKIYWISLFGALFTRDNQEEFPVNRLLNYGYAILRSCVARAVAAAGLHPAIGLYHHNRFNPFCLVDDLMEPFRPVVDHVILKLFRGDEELSTQVKKTLVSILRMDMQTDEGRSPLNVSIQKFITSVAISFEENKLLLRNPCSSLPIDSGACSADIG